eukprot:jgi/Orpsp1_1/1191551/evm.model.d7180000086902.1
MKSKQKVDNPEHETNNEGKSFKLTIGKISSSPGDEIRKQKSNSYNKFKVVESPEEEEEEENSIIDMKELNNRKILNPKRINKPGKEKDESTNILDITNILENNPNKLLNNKLNKITKDVNNSIKDNSLNTLKNKNINNNNIEVGSNINVIKEIFNMNDSQIDNIKKLFHESEERTNVSNNMSKERNKANNLGSVSINKSKNSISKKMNGSHVSFENIDHHTNNTSDGGEKHINLASNTRMKPYNIEEDIANTPCNITFGQVLDICPKLRRELTKSLRLKNVKYLSALSLEDDSLIYNYESVKEINKNFKNDDLGMVFASIDDQQGKLLIDSGSNLNLVTTKYLEQLPGEYEQVGFCHGRIYEALGDSTMANAIVVRLTININDFIFTADFCVIDHKMSYFDMLIGLKTTADNCFFIHPLLKSLCRFTTIENFDILAPILDEQDSEKVACFIKFDSTHKSVNFLNNINENEDIVDVQNVKVKEDMTPSEYISSPEFASTIDDEYYEEIVDLLAQYIDIIAVSSDDLTPSKLNPHCIKLIENVKPFKSKYYRLNKIKSDILKEELTKLYNKGLITPSYSSWSSPIVLVAKKNGKWRLCADYRKLNSLTVPDSYSLPHIDEIFSSLCGAKIFSTLDLFSGYHQIRMDDDSIDLTSFTTRYGNFVYKVMPFGLCGAPATFQREMNRILFNLLGVCVFIFLDDILIFSKDEKEHFKHLSMVFAIFREYEIKINIEKCCFFKTEIEVLGHIVSKDGLKMIRSKIDAILNWEKPKNITELKSFLGTVGYYRKFIFNISKLAAPLNVLLRKNVPFEWTNNQQLSFDNLKHSLTRAPILVYPDYSKQFIIRTDASYEGLGAVLLQIQDYDQIEHPIYFISRTLSKAEKNYCITDLEGSAVYFAACEFKPYISGNPYETLVITDHKPLVGLFKNKEPHNMRHIRWCLTISMLRIKIIYEEGKKNSLADALSRIKPMDNSLINNKNIFYSTSFINKNLKNNLNNSKFTLNNSNNTSKFHIPNTKISNKNFINFDKNLFNDENFKNFCNYEKFENLKNFQNWREKWGYIENLKFLEISKESLL